MWHRIWTFVKFYTFIGATISTVNIQMVLSRLFCSAKVVKLRRFHTITNAGRLIVNARVDISASRCQVLHRRYLCIHAYTLSKTRLVHSNEDNYLASASHGGNRPTQLKFITTLWSVDQIAQLITTHESRVMTD